MTGAITMTPYWRTPDSPLQRMIALRRLYDQYVHTAYAADQQFSPVAPLLTLPELTFGAVVSSFDSAPAAASWFRREHSALTFLIRAGVHSRYASHAWRLAYLLNESLHRAGRFQASYELARLGLDAALHAEDRLGQAYCHRSSGIAAGRLGDYERAQADLFRAATIFGTIGMRAHEAMTLSDLSIVMLDSGQPEEASVIAQRAQMRIRAARTL